MELSHLTPHARMCPTSSTPVPVSRTRLGVFSLAVDLCSLSVVCEEYFFITLQPRVEKYEVFCGGTDLLEPINKYIVSDKRERSTPRGRLPTGVERTWHT